FNKNERHKQRHIIRNCSSTKLLFVVVAILISALLYVSISLAFQVLAVHNNDDVSDKDDVHQLAAQNNDNQGTIRSNQADDGRSSALHSTATATTTNNQQQQIISHTSLQSSANNNNNNEDNIIFDDPLTKWIREQRNVNSDNNSKSSSSAKSVADLLSTPLYFKPGTLPLSQLSTLQHCHVNPQIYKNHLRGGPGQLSYSKKYNLSYILIPKSGSSTGRYMMQHEFEAVEPRGGYNNKAVREAYEAKHIIAFVREPLSRFYSQYDEAYVRTAPWSKSQNPYYIDPDDSNNKNRKVHPFPFLYENFNSYHDYEDVFCPPSTRTNPNNRRECLFRPSHEDGTLAKRLERFVQEYDGRTPYDVHLILQVPKLLSKDGSSSGSSSINITELYNTTNAKNDWKTIAKKYIGEHAKLLTATTEDNNEESGGVIEGRSYPRRFDKKFVGKETEKRICQLALLDYCCLNFPLPSSCDGGKGDEEVDDLINLSCKMDYDVEGGKVRVQPGVFPDGGKV
ncbi:hypothetical protein ACHAWC_006160, partial [Mediolabrus comicus]